MQKKTKGIITVVLTLALVGFAAYAFAGWAKGGGQMGRGEPGWHHRGWGGPGGYPGYGPSNANMSEETYQKLETQRQAFLKETETLRGDIYQKNLALRSELAKKEPDANTALAIQKEISDLKADLDQKRLAHIMQMQKINPDAGRGFMAGGPRGKGGGYGQGKGFGCGPRNGGGYCWE